MRKAATFSEDRTYRYTLTRAWDHEKPRVVFIGLNPSTADEAEDDPTVRRCINYARDWGAGAMTMLNIFAFRATNPAVMKAHAEPIGSENDRTLVTWTAGAQAVVACWGVHGEHLDRGHAVRWLVNARGLRVFGLTKDGHPKHPLYLPKSLRLTRWEERS